MDGDHSVLADRELTGTSALPEDIEADAAEPALRPTRFSDFVGQKVLKGKLSREVASARSRGETLDHTLLSGPPGLGKTTLAAILAAEMEAPFVEVMGPSITRPADIVTPLLKLEAGSILFVDEIHRVPAKLCELLYSAMEDYKIALIIGEGADANTVKLDIPPFTLVGATTRMGMLEKPFLERFLIQERLEMYSVEELTEVVTRAAGLWEMNCGPDALVEVAARARFTPRTAKRLLRRVRTYADAAGGILDLDTARLALSELNIDRHGLNSLDQRYLEILGRSYGGGPAGLATLSSSLNEDEGTVESSVEPFLLEMDFIIKTNRGRKLSQKGRQWLKERRAVATKPVAQDLFNRDG